MKIKLMEMKKISLYALFLLWGWAVHAQISTVGNVMGTAGGTGIVGTHTSDYTIGGTAVTTTDKLGNGQYLTQGFLQANYTIIQLLLTFDNLPGKTYGDVEFELFGTSSDGTEVIYTSTDPSIATIVNGKFVKIIGAGSTYITATIKNTNISRQQLLVVDKASQTITFDFIPVLQKNGGPVTMNAYASSGLPVSFNGRNGFVVRVNGNILTPIDIGKATIEAIQEGNNNYKPALITQVVTVEDKNGPPVVVPSVLSPDGDGLNDKFVIKGIENFPQNSLLIVNRNGTKVFYAKNYNNSEVIFNGSDDRSRDFTGKAHSITGLLPQGTYFYVFEYLDGKTLHKKTGFFILKY